MLSACRLATISVVSSFPLTIPLSTYLPYPLTNPSSFTEEDAEYLTRLSALPPARIRAIMTGSCPHAAIREDISLNLSMLTRLHTEFHTDLLLIESGGDNLAANYSRELADFIIYVIDVAGGDKVPRKGGPGTTESDLLVINKCDLAGAVGADLEMMERQARGMREGGPVVMGVVKPNKEGKRGEGYEGTVGMVVDLILSAWRSSGAYEVCRRGWEKEERASSGKGRRRGSAWV